MKKKVKKRLWPIAGAIIVGLGSLIVKTSLKKAWKGVKHKKPPKADQRVSNWKDMVLWTFISSLISAFSKLLLSQTSRWAGERLDAV